MAEYFPRPSNTDKGDGNLQGFQAMQPPQVRASGDKATKDGKQWINQHNVGTMNENRFTSLKPKSQTK